jgi:hypothetical protein
MKKPSPAQAKMIAWVWCGPRSAVAIAAPGSGGYTDPTDRVLIRNGWLEDIGEGEPYPSGTPTRLYRVSQAGLEALKDFFRGGAK